MKQKNAGFTLVELVVVIAILGILAGVGTVAYSGYVKRAGQAADEALIEEVKYALTLGVYAGNYPAGDLGLVVLSGSGAAAENCLEDADGNEIKAVDDMLEAAFGADWETALTLKSDLTGGAYADYSAVIGSVKDAGEKDYAESVPDSTFYTVGSTDDLMGEVTGVVSGFAEALADLSTVDVLTKLWGTEFKAVTSGMDYATNETLTANLTVWAAANSIAGAADSTREKWIATWSDQGSAGFSVASGDTASGMVAPAVLYYAKLNALAKYADSKDSECSALEVFNNSLGTLKNATDSSGFFDALGTIEKNLKREIPPGTVSEYYTSGQAETDAKAFVATMGALNSLEGSYVTQDNLSSLADTAFFSENPAVSELLTYFVRACGNAELLQSVDGAGYVIFAGVGENGEPIVG